MEGLELPVTNADEAARVIRALGTHRYIAGRMHLVHAAVLASMVDLPTDGTDLTLAVKWALVTLANPTIDRASRDPQLHRRCDEKEVAAILRVFWSSGEHGDTARKRLRAFFADEGLSLGERPPFADTGEDDLFPILIDAGWELLPLASLDSERHKGAIDAFGERILFDAARFEEESAIPSITHLQELSAMGARELLEAIDDNGALRHPFTLWTEGCETLHAYVIRGVLRAAKLEPILD